MSGELLDRRKWFGLFGELYFVSELSVRRIFRSPKMVRTVRRTILRFLTDLLMTFKLQPEFRCANCTHTRVHTLTHETCSYSFIDCQNNTVAAQTELGLFEDRSSTHLSSIRGRNTRQWTPLLCHALTDNVVPPISAQMIPFPPKGEAENVNTVLHVLLS